MKDPSTAPGKRVFRDGHEDGLIPLEPLDLDRIGSFEGLLEAMKKTAFGGRHLGEALDVLHEMVRDPDCKVVATFSGAMTVAKMGLLISHMIDRGYVQVVIATGGLLTHGLVETAGLTHFRAAPGADDAYLYRRGYNRVYDTIETEKNLEEAEELSVAALESLLEKGIDRFGSRALLKEIGRILCERRAGRGILVSAYEKDVPVYIPAFSDSELGLDMPIWILKKARERDPSVGFLAAIADCPFRFDPLLDLGEYVEFLQGCGDVGIFVIGGGVPRNWGQQGPCCVDLLARRGLVEDGLGKRFRYGVRICPEPVHWGGLSGCTFAEGVSWGKFMAPEEGGRFAEVLADATIAWPILIKALDERMEKARG